MIVSIMQPAYLPWLGYFDRIIKSDLHIVLDHVQIDLNSKTKFANRNKIRTAQGWAWLTVPIMTKGQRGELFLNKIGINEEENWRHKHWQGLKMNYGKAPFFATHGKAFEDIYKEVWPNLAALCRAVTEPALRALDIGTPVRYSSEMDVPGEKDALILNLCKAAGASAYISGPFGRDYLNTADFEAAGIKLYFHDYPHPVYKQAFEGFEPYMSAVDLLFNHGPESRTILASPQTSLKTA